jgi:hypothetical protein
MLSDPGSSMDPLLNAVNDPMEEGAAIVNKRDRSTPPGWRYNSGNPAAWGDLAGPAVDLCPGIRVRIGERRVMMFFLGPLRGQHN